MAIQQFYTPKNFYTPQKKQISGYAPDVWSVTGNGYSIIKHLSISPEVFVCVHL